MSLSAVDRTHLEHSPLLVALTGEQIDRLLAVGRVESYRAGTDIIREGDPGDALYLILSGRVRISARNRSDVAVLSGDATLQSQYEGDFFGEMSILDHEARSATVTSEGEVTVFRIGKEELFDLFASDVDFQVVLLTNVGRILSRRLRKFIARVSAER